VCSANSFDALEARVNALTAELAKVKEHSEAVNQRYVALEASRGISSDGKTDHREGQLDKNSAIRQRVNETVAAIMTKRSA